MDALTHAIDRTLDTIEGGMPLSPETKALRRPAAGGTSEKQAIVAIGKEVLRQGQLIDRLARQPGDPTTLRGAHDRKMRAWGTYQDLLTRERREARRGRPDSLTRRGLTRLDGDLDRMGALERRLARVEAKRNRPPMGQPSGMIRTYDPGMRPAGKTSRIGAYLSSATMRAYRGAVVQHLKTGSEMFHGLHIVDLHRLRDQGHAHGA